MRLYLMFNPVYCFVVLFNGSCQEKNVTAFHLNGEERAGCLFFVAKLIFVIICFLPVDVIGRLWSVIFIPRHTIVAGYYGFTLVVLVSVRPSFSRPSVRFSFPDDNLSKYEWIFTKLGMRIDIVKIWFGIANGQVS